MTQCEQILRHLRQEGSITQREAARRYEIYRLAARIYDLRREGHQIEKEMETSDTGKSYARYYLNQPALQL
jgi:hypothetical protein